MPGMKNKELREAFPRRASGVINNRCCHQQLHGAHASTAGSCRRGGSPGTRQGWLALGKRAACPTASGRDAHADSPAHVFLPPSRRCRGKVRVVYLLQSPRTTNTRSAQPPRCKRAPAALRRRCHCPAPADGGEIPNHSRRAGTSLGFVAVMNGPPRDSYGEGKAQLLPLLGGSGWVAFDEESLWVLATHTFVSSTTEDVVFLTAYCRFVVTPHLAVSR